MKVDMQRARALLRAGDLRELFVEVLGWDHHTQTLEVDLSAEGVWRLEALAEKRGMIAWRCPAGDGRPPDYQLRAKIEQRVARASHEHLVVFTDAACDWQIWHWVRREPGLPVARREQQFHRPQSGDPLLQRLEAIAFGLEEENRLTIVDVTGRARAAFDVERVTKRFYDRFKAEHDAFVAHVDGIPDDEDRKWYASVMLNRLMFVYFLQKKGFLDGDPHYLRNRLKPMQERHQTDRFYSFYRNFLLRLFHEGLGARERAPEFEALIGRVPYLNGGVFDVHPLERPDRYGAAIQIPDRAFEAIFAYFDEYRWHLDERPLRDDREINPDVLGYIFERYVNQRQMGAYYTKEDVTEYIAKSTTIPWLLDAARRDCRVAFENNGGPTVWDRLRENPDRYIYPSIRHAVSWDWSPADPRRGTPLDAPRALPPNVEAASRAPDAPPDAPLPDLSCLNQAAPPSHGLPSETWREVLARRRRLDELRQKLRAGEVRAVDDLVTLNLDVRQFAEDVISGAEGPELLRALWKAIQNVTVLDPTCGSGAFLFAALNILEPLHDACLDRMAAFVGDLERSGESHRPEKLSDFRAVLQRLQAHPNRRYSILKSIILRNLYGVDIMDEAVEICKLRLFLKLAAQVEPDASAPNLGIEPLPDIDFNIRSGNTLVGFATLQSVREAAEKELERAGAVQMKLMQLGDVDAEVKRLEVLGADLAQACASFRERQMEGDGSVPAADKERVRERARGLNDEVNRYLARQYGVDPANANAFDGWLATHRPFNWFVDFHSIMMGGGFSAVIGNPPYVARSKVDYLARPGHAPPYPDIYGLVVERALDLTQSRGRSSMIVPLSLTFSEDFGGLRRRLVSNGSLWVSSFDNIPAALFAGVSQRCSIWVSSPAPDRLHTSAMYRWRSAGRPHLLDSLGYFTDVDAPLLGEGFAKIGCRGLGSTLVAMHRRGSQASRQLLSGACLVGYSQAARNFVSVFLVDPPCLDETTLALQSPSQVTHLPAADQRTAHAALAALVGCPFLSYWMALGDGFHVTAGVLRGYLACLRRLSDDHFALLAEVGEALHARRNEALVFKKNAGRYVGNYNYRSLGHLTLRADLLLLQGISVPPDDALEVIEYVRRVLAINEHAGEKGIPPELKERFPPPPADEAAERTLLERVDALLERQGFPRSYLRYLLASA
ncbi:MAG TPA: DNA methyltransferase [Chthonomonadales bacterium]|nr:DNA methyltransferase [Chthonomonadales bacterium]